jgi:protein transport protein SEC61 subunit alpha
MPIIFSTSSLALPATLARFTGLEILKKAAIALTPGGKLRGFLVYFATDI